MPFRWRSAPLYFAGGSIMVWALGVFLVVFSVLSFIVRLDALGGLFGAGAFSFFAVDVLVAQFSKSPRSPRMPGEPLL
jgi:hypothetical protein